MDLVTFRGTRHEVGRQIGARYRDLITGWVATHGAWHRPGLSRRLVVRACDRIFHLLSTIAPDLCLELDGIAAGADLSLEDVLCYNFHNALLHLPAACTNLIMRHSDRGPLLIKNHDAAPADRVYYQLHHLIYDDGPQLLVVTCGGTIWGQGLSARGMASGGSSVHPRASTDQETGLPDAVIGRLLLERAGTVAEAIELFRRLSYQGKGCNYALCDATGDAAILEAAGEHKVIRRSEDDCLHCTNYYASGAIEHAPEPDYLAHAVGRARLLDFHLSDSTERTVARAQHIMASHHGPISLCRHAATDSLRQDTILSHLALPALGRLLVADGFPCQAAWVEYEV